jgi:hypothetical protein
MHVRTIKIISDTESFKKGTQKIVDAYNKYFETTTEKGGEYFDWYATNDIIQDYNKGTSCGSEVIELHGIVKTIL